MKKYSDIYQIFFKSCLLLVLFLLVSCSDNVTVDNAPVLSDAAISFSALQHWDEDKQTRTTEVYNNFSDGDTIGVYAYYNTNADTTEFMSNQPIVYKNGTWTYSPLKYWPQDGNIGFYAYAPYNASAPMKKQDGKMLLKWNVENDVTKQKDLLMPASIVNVDCKDKKVVQFVFSHALSNIHFSVNNATSQSVKVKHISLFSNDEEVKIYDKADLEYDENDASLSWSNLNVNNPNKRSYYDFYAGESLKDLEVNAATTTNITLGNHAAYLIPQSGVGVKGTVYYEKNGKGYARRFEIGNQNWLKGQQYNYKIKFADTDSDMPAGKDEWNDAYEKLDWVESTAKTSPVNLDILTNGGDWGVYMRLLYTDNTVVDSYPLGVLIDGKSIGNVYMHRFYAMGINTENMQCGWGNNMVKNFSFKDSNSVRNKEYEFEMNYKNSGIVKTKTAGEEEKVWSTKLKNSLKNPDGEPYFDSDEPIYIFGINKPIGASTWIGRIYEVSLSRKEELIMHLVPCRRIADKAIGMYDTLSGKFFKIENALTPDSKN